MQSRSDFATGRARLADFGLYCMGIDIYAEWRGMTVEESNAQVMACFDGTVGHIGYLREAYHGEPYATRVLFPEAFEKGDAAIPAARLRERLPATLAAVRRNRPV